VLLTGAAGLLGGEIAAQLVARGFAVTALVHRETAVLGNDGAPVPVSCIVHGDVSFDRFGWDASAWASEAASHDLIVHCAAVTAFDADPGLLARVNVGGTATALALAQAGGMGFLHVSTAYVNDARAGIVREDTPPSSAGLNPYAASKAAAEALVHAASVRMVIARPSIVVGDAHGRVRRFDGFYLLFKAFAEGRLRTMPATPGATLDLVPIDHVAGGIADLAEHFGRSAGGTYHLVSGAPTPVGAIPATLARFPGLCVPETVAPADFDPDAALPAAERRLFARVAAPYAPYFTRVPRFDDRAMRAVTGRAPPALGADWWVRLIDYCLSAGFIRAGRAGSERVNGTGAPCGDEPQASRSRPKGIASDRPAVSSAGSR